MNIKRFFAFLSAGILLAGCSGPKESIPEAASALPPASRISASPMAEQANPEASAASNPESPGPQEKITYIDQVVQDTIAKFAAAEMSEYEKAKAAFDYLIENTILDDPVGLDLWRIRDESGRQPSFVENRSLSVLLYGVGMCEDYAAALTMLLRGMGLEAEYIPGLTYSRQGALVDHAWTMAKIDEVWYHLDCQLEDNISRHGSIRYGYFMRGDDTMAGSHRWGQNLINSGLLTPEQNEEIARGFMGEPCPRDYPKPDPHPFTSAPAPDLDAIQTEIVAEFSAYEQTYGALPPLELDIIPPVFGLDGFGPQD